ncbi:MAG: hypothetical protein ACKO9Z_09435 [Planctomycetota bacterium]
MPRQAFLLESLESRALPAVSLFLVPPIEADAPFLLGCRESESPELPESLIAISGLPEGGIPLAVAGPAQGGVATLLVAEARNSARLYTINTVDGAAVALPGLLELSDFEGLPIGFPETGDGCYAMSLAESGELAISVSGPGSSLAFRADAATGLAIDSDPMIAGTQPDGLGAFSVDAGCAIAPPMISGISDLAGVSGIQSGEKPALGVYSGETEYIFAVAPGGNSATLYVEASDEIRAFTMVGAPGGISLDDLDGQDILFPDPESVFYWGWADGESGLIHVSFASGGMLTTFRLDGETGLALDGDAEIDGVQPDLMQPDPVASLFSGQWSDIAEFPGIPSDAFSMLGGFFSFMFRGLADMVAFSGMESMADGSDLSGHEPAVTSLAEPMLARALETPSSQAALGGRMSAEMAQIPAASMVVTTITQDSYMPVIMATSCVRQTSVRRFVDRVPDTIDAGDDRQGHDDESLAPFTTTGNGVSAPEDQRDPKAVSKPATEPEFWLPLADDLLPDDPAGASVVDANPVAGSWVLAGILGAASISTGLVREPGKTTDWRKRREQVLDGCFGSFGM